MDGGSVQVVSLPIWKSEASSGGQGWQPRSAAGCACVFSHSANAFILHGGVTPDEGRSAQLCTGQLMDRSAPHQPPALCWSVLTPSMSIPRRCYQGATLLAGALGGDRLLIALGHLALLFVQPRLKLVGFVPDARQGH